MIFHFTPYLSSFHYYPVPFHSFIYIYLALAWSFGLLSYYYSDIDLLFSPYHQHNPLSSTVSGKTPHHSHPSASHQVTVINKPPLTHHLHYHYPITTSAIAGYGPLWPTKLPPADREQKEKIEEEKERSMYIKSYISRGRGPCVSCHPLLPYFLPIRLTTCTFYVLTHRSLPLPPLLHPFTRQHSDEYFGWGF